MSLSDITPDLSICIVNYNAKKLLDECLESIYCNTKRISFEIFVVDNGSVDGSTSMVKEKYPEVKLIENDCNVGFAKANNQALRESQGRYVLLLNNDTVVLPNALDKLVEFMDSHPEAGACGARLLNPDGTLQPQCRRGFQTPIAAVSHLLYLDRLFPKSRIFGKYFLTYLDSDKTHEVDTVSGACELVRREAMDKVGMLDEQFFIYSEDIDWCLRIKKAGWKVYYVYEAEIIHYGGQGGTKHRSYNMIIQFHKSYHLFYRKHYAAGNLFLINWFIYSLLVVKLGLSILRNLLAKEKRAGSKK